MFIGLLFCLILCLFIRLCITPSLLKSGAHARRIGQKTGRSKAGRKVRTVATSTWHSGLGFRGFYMGSVKVLNPSRSP